ncbi:MAG: hypothetical protein A2136_00435 [Chloroflexi bacterium RBG_16_54_11]|nr:MAG: hypothetical protein A2136_00435 [Chloroflexi bacterium RBG_16_54_11]
MATTIKINRAPVLTLWGVIVAERLGYKHDEALTLGKAVAGLNAQSKGQRLGIYSPAEKELDEKRSKRDKERQTGETFMVDVLGRGVPAMRTEHGLRATVKGEGINPKSVERYLEQKFGAELAEVRTALEALVEAISPQELERRAYALYEQFRPEIPEGRRGWGAAGDLNLARIRKMANKG